MATNDTTPFSLQLFDAIIAVVRATSGQQVEECESDHINLAIQNMTTAYSHYIKELSSDEPEWIRQSGWGICGRNFEVFPLLDWHLRMTVALNENVIRHESSNTIYRAICDSHMIPEDISNTAFCMMMPGLMLHVRDANSRYYFVDYMVWNKAGYALRSCLRALTKFPVSNWYAEDSPVIPRDHFVKLLTMSVRSKVSDDLWKWIMGSQLIQL